MSDWLPLLMPRPEIFAGGVAFPDIGPINEPLLVEAVREQPGFTINHVGRLDRADMTRQQERNDVLWDLHMETVGDELDTRNVTQLLRSIPAFIESHLFAQGCVVGRSTVGSYRGSSTLPFEEDFAVLLSRSFVTFTRTSAGSRPLYNSTYCEWLEHVPAPDFSPWPDGCPFQVFIPYDRPGISHHHRIQAAALLEDEVQMLGHKFGWGTAAPTVTLDLQSYFARTQ